MRIDAALKIDAGLLRFHEEAYVTEVRFQIEGVVGTLLRMGDADPTLNLDLLLVGIVFALVIHIPTESFPERVDEILARLGFLIPGQQVRIPRMSPEAVDKFTNAGMCDVECSGWRGLIHNGCAPSLRMSRYFW